MVIFGFLAFLIEIIFAEVTGLFMTSIILGDCSFPKIFLPSRFPFGWGYGREDIYIYIKECSNNFFFLETNKHTRKRKSNFNTKTHYKFHSKVIVTFKGIYQ